MKFEKLKNIVEVKKGKKPSFVDTPDENSVRVLQIDDLRNDTNPKFTNDKTGVFAKEDDVLIAWDGANAGTIGYGKAGYIGSTIALLRKKKPDLYSTTFIGIFLQSQYQYLRSKTTGATIPHISRKALDELEVPVISVNDQLHIANLLSKAEKLIVQRKESIRLLDDFLKSTFLEMFGDPVRNEKGWETKTIEQLVKKEKYALKRGPFGGALKKEIFVQSGYLVYEQFHALNNDFSFARYFIDEAKFQELKGFEVKPGDIIVSCSGVYLGKLAIVPKGAKQGIINQALLKISLDNSVIENVFFVYVFSNENFKRKFYGNVIGTGIPNFPSMDDFKKFNFIYPPLEFQTQFAHIVEKTETLKTQYRQSLQELENLYGCLSQRAFRGELSIKKVVSI
jgi:type I restriction enzyme S subunit